MRRPARATRVALISLVVGLAVLPVSAATYQPGPDADLARRAPVIVRASVVSQESRLESVGGRLRPFTIVTLAALETIKGSVPEAFSVRLPGGRVGDTVAWVPGTPVFSGGAEVVLFLERAAGAPGMYRLTEFGLSKFDLVADEDGRRFAVRPVFGPRQDLLAADRGDVLAGLAEKSAVPARDAGSFLAALSAIASGREPGEIVWRERSPKGQRRPKWVNIGGREPGDCGGGDPCLFRWYWDTSGSPNGVVTVTGTQSNLTNDDAAGCGTDSICDVQHAVDEWIGIAGTHVVYSGPAATGNITVALDALTDFNGGTAWTTALGCGAGVIGLGGPANATGPRTYRGDGDYYASQTADVSMRKVTCSTGYSARTFKTAVMHELGHTLGLGHPDLETGMHSTTASATWDSAVMTSVVPQSKPDVPQTDDVQGIQYYYTTGSLGVPPGANFTVSPGSPATGSAIQFTDTSSGGPTAWNWTFGDAASGDLNHSTSRNPTHVFFTPGTYTVTLVAGSGTGSGTTTKTVTVAQGTAACSPSTTTMCLNNNRFAVTAAYRTNDGRSGNGTGTELTADSGYFYFFNAANIEVVIKVLNACPVNGAYWVFAAGLTNVEVTLRVVDTQNGTVKTYFNPLGTAFAPVQDTSAFATCP